MQFVLIVLLSVAISVVYGIVHDLVGVRLCAEYFTLGHPPLFATDNLTLLGLGWGVLETWWMGAAVGILLAVAARAGELPKRSAEQLIRPMITLLECMAAFAVLAGILGYWAAHNRYVVLAEPLWSQVTSEHRIWFMVDMWTNLASYIGGMLGGLILIGWVWASRQRERGLKEMEDRIWLSVQV